MADRSRDKGQSGAYPLLCLLAPAEDAFAQAVVHELGCEHRVVRTRREFEHQQADHGEVLVGDHQSPADRVSTVRRSRRRDEPPLVAAIGNDLPMRLELLEAGARAVGSLTDDPRKFAERITAARNGQVLLDPAETAAVVNRLQHLAHLCVDQGVDVGRCARLTPREAEIASLLARKFDNGKIGRELGIAVGTVKTHVHKILEKLDVDSRGLAGIYWRVYTEKQGERR